MECSNCLAEKNLYMDIVALGFDHFMTSLSMVKVFSPSIVSLFVFFFLAYTDMFFFRYALSYVRKAGPPLDSVLLNTFENPLIENVFSRKESNGGPALRTYASAYLKKNMSV